MPVDGPLQVPPGGVQAGECKKRRKESFFVFLSL
jgi:hypothetical protein